MALQPAHSNRRQRMQAKAGMNYRNSGTIGSAGNYTGVIPSRLSKLWRKDRSSDRVPNLVGQERYDLIQRARALCRNNPFAKQLVKKAADNIIQSGFKLSTKCPSNREYAYQVSEAYRLWTATASAQGHSWIEHQRLVCEHLLREGDVGVLFGKGAPGSGGNLQIIPSASIRNPSDMSDRAIFDGVEVDDTLRPMAFHVSVGDLGAGQTKRVSHEHFHLYALRDDALDLRGVPCFAGYWDLFDQLDAFVLSVVSQAKAQADLVMSVESTGGGPSGYAQTQTDSDGVKYESTETCTVMILPDGKKVVYHKADAISLDVDRFLTAILKIISPSVGIPIEMLMTSMANYASSQAAVQDAWKSFKTIQHGLVHGEERSFMWWFNKAIDEGRLLPPPDDFTAKFITPGFLYVNRVESVQADLLEINAGFTTSQAVLHRRGEDYDAIQEQLNQEELDRKEYGRSPLPLSTFIQAQPNIEQLAQAVSNWQAKAGKAS